MGRSIFRWIPSDQGAVLEYASYAFVVQLLRHICRRDSAGQNRPAASEHPQRVYLYTRYVAAFVELMPYTDEESLVVCKA